MFQNLKASNGNNAWHLGGIGTHNGSKSIPIRPQRTVALPRHEDVLQPPPGGARPDLDCAEEGGLHLDVPGDVPSTPGHPERLPL